MVYILLLLSAYLILREIKSLKHKKRILLIYASIFCVALCYNMGSFVGKQMYLLGFSI